ncbi:MAG: hypothetical protein ACWGPR_11720 [Candidatus Deferrimicrobiaceae bacterium]
MRERAVAFLLTALASARLLARDLCRTEVAEVLPNGALLSLSCIGVA